MPQHVVDDNIRTVVETSQTYVACGINKSSPCIGYGSQHMFTEKTRVKCFRQHNIRSSASQSHTSVAVQNNYTVSNSFIFAELNLFQIFELHRFHIISFSPQFLCLIHILCCLAPLVWGAMKHLSTDTLMTHTLT